MIPGKMVKGMGGAMDLVHGAKRVHRHDGAHRQGRHAQDRRGLHPAATPARRGHRIITDLAVIDVNADGLVLVETAPGVTSSGPGRYRRTAKDRDDGNEHDLGSLRLLRNKASSNSSRSMYSRKLK